MKCVWLYAGAARRLITCFLTWCTDMIQESYKWHSSPSPSWSLFLMGSSPSCVAIRVRRGLRSLPCALSLVVDGGQPLCWRVRGDPGLATMLRMSRIRVQCKPAFIDLVDPVVDPRVDPLFSELSGGTAGKIVAEKTCSSWNTS